MHILGHATLPRLAGLLLVLFAAILLPTSSTPTLAQSSNPALQPCTPSAGSSATAATDSPAATTSDSTSAQALYVVTTVAPLTNITFNIAGTRVHIHGLIPEGTDSHTFEPRPSDAEFIAQADVIFLNGLHLEDPTKKLAEANSKQG